MTRVVLWAASAVLLFIAVAAAGAAILVAAG